MVNLRILILTFNEELHIERCIKNALQVSEDIVVVDSFSTDDTVKIATKLGAQVLQRKFDYHANQLNWALSQFNNDAFILRLDADEYMDEQLIKSIKENVQNGFKFDCYLIGRRIKFFGKLINYGGSFPNKVTRLFKLSAGRFEQRAMDERFATNSKLGYLYGEIIDDNRNSLSWWLSKHVRYSSLEALAQYSAEQGRGEISPKIHLSIMKRVFLLVYFFLPSILRPSMLFMFRYVLCLGFMDGYKGFQFHFLQSFWYRSVVEFKLSEIKRFKTNDATACAQIAKILDIEEALVRSVLLQKK